MKLMNSKSVIRGSAAALSLALGLLLFVPSVALAESGEQTEVFARVVEGPFDGLDLKTKSIWINDTVYRLDGKVKVKGTPKKLGLITDLKQGEQVRVTLRENTREPSIPYVILIQRQ